MSINEIIVNTPPGAEVRKLVELTEESYNGKVPAIKKGTQVVIKNGVLGVYYVVDDSQILISSFELSGIQALEKDLASSPMAQYVEVVSKYEFQETILFDFINSGYDDFEDFVALIANPTE